MGKSQHEDQGLPEPSPPWCTEGLPGPEAAWGVQAALHTWAPSCWHKIPQTTLQGKTNLVLADHIKALLSPMPAPFFFQQFSHYFLHYPPATCEAAE